MPRDYERGIISVDAALFTLRDDALCVVLARRDKNPFYGELALPGGFVHADEDEDAAATARRVLRDKTGISVPYLEQLYSFTGKKRDPRGWSVSIAYFALVSESELKGDDFFIMPVDDLPAMLPFDHLEIIKMATKRLRGKAVYSALPAYLLPRHFTIPELQKVYEKVMGTALDKRSFRRKIESQHIVEKVRGGIRHTTRRPAQIYRLSADHLKDFSRSAQMPSTN